MVKLLIFLLLFVAFCSFLQAFAQSRSKKIAKFSNLPDGTQLPFSAAILATGAIKRKRKVIVYGRYSTDTQNDSSVEDQYAFCERWINDQGWNADIEYLCDRAISGERDERPGIDNVRNRIKSGMADSVVVEDASRLYRDSHFLTDLIRLSIDKNTIVYCINDQFSSDSPDWEMKLMLMAMHHSFYNRDNAMRIKRAHDGIWNAGYAIGCVKAGYKRLPVNPADEGQVQKGPFKDVKDECWGHVIIEIFERIARGDSPRHVAKFVTKSGLPKYKFGKDNKWRASAIRSLVRNPIYKGIEKFRRKHSVKIFSSGKHVQKKTTPEDVLTREKPELAYVDAKLWQRANDMIDGRQTNSLMKPNEPGSAFDARRIGRRRLLHNKFTCNICGAQMVKTGHRDGNTYQCSLAKRDECWNKMISRTDVVHEKIIQAIIEQLQKQDGFTELIIAEAEQIFKNGEDFGSKIEKLRSELNETLKKQKHLSLAIEQGGELEALLAPLSKLDENAKRIKEDIAYLESQRDSLVQPITREDIIASMDSVIKSVSEYDSDSEELWSIIRPLIAEVRAVPCKRFDNQHDVARGRIRLNLRALMPRQWQEFALSGDLSDKLEAISPEFDIDLFHPYLKERYAQAAYQCRQEKVSRKDIMARFGLTRGNYDATVAFGKKMAQLGIVDMFFELTHCPGSFLNAKIPDYGKELVARDYKPHKNENQPPYAKGKY